MIRSYILFLALSGSAMAQDPPPLRLTLRESVALALKQNPQVILAVLNTAQAEQERALARSGLLPQVDARVQESVNRVNLAAAIGFQFPGFAQHVGPYWVSQAGTNFSAPIFDLTLWRRYKATQYGIEASRAGEITSREEIVLAVVSQYLGSQRAAADVQAAQSRVELAQALHEQAADLQKSGVGTGLDTLRANVTLQNEKQRLIVARTQLETSLFGLSRLLNLDPRRRVELADAVSFFETPPANGDQTLEIAWRMRPEMRQILSDEQRAETDLRAASDQRLPRLTLTGYWAQQGLTPATAIPVYQYEWGIDVPVFTGGRIKAERTRAEIVISQLKQQEQDLRNRIALEVKTAIAELESARSEVEVANLGIQLARQQVEQSRDRFQAGVANNVEVIQAQDELARANDNQIAALYRFNQSRANLAHSVGQMEAVYAR
jgi:outer membrane protein TolC